MNLQSLDIGEPVENLIGAVVVLAVRDATEGDTSALEWLKACAPDVAQHLTKNGGSLGTKGRRRAAGDAPTGLVESLQHDCLQPGSGTRQGIAGDRGCLAGHFQDRQAERVDRGIAA